MNKNKDILKILANWLTDNEFYSHGGVVENAIKSAKEDVCETIASYINEIIEMDDEQIDNIIKEIEREELK